MSGNLMAVSQKNAEDANNGSNGSRKILVLFIMGIFIIFLGVVVLTVAAMLSGSGSASFGGFIFIGPIPIIVGGGPEAPWLTVMAVILTIMGIVVFLIMRRQVAKPNARD
jgi:uncharacterized membrane protein